MKRVLRKFAGVGRRAGWIGLALLALPLSAQAALTVTPLTWNIVGLDSNSPTTGPQHFPVGARICAGPGGSVGGITADLVWDSANAGVYERPGSDISLSFPALAAGACTDAYYEIEVDDVLAPYDTTRRYHISATDGSGSYSSPTPRELYVEHLVSQSRNAITNVRYGPNPLSLTAVAPGGGMNLVVGNTYTIELSGGTATQGYEQFEAFINFTNTIFQILDVSTTYSADTTPYVSSPHSALYGDACLWENDPASPNYRACLDVGKIGGSTVVTLYTIKIIGGGGTSQTLNTLLYDFSGSSYHYNADFGTGSRIANIIDPTTATIAKSFTPSLIPMNGISTLKITLANPNPGTLTGYNFDDFLPAGMSVATPATFTTSNCGTPTFAPSGGDFALAFSNGTVAANSSCTITVGVTAGVVGSYVNTTDHLFIDSTDTGDDATATLTVNSAPPLPPLLCGIALGRWNFESGFTVTAPAASSSIVSVTAGAGAGVTPQSSTADNTIAPAGTVSWRSNGGIATTALATTNNDYFEFSADTSAYDAVYLAFDGYRTTNGPRGVAVYAGSAAGNPETGTQLYSNSTVLSAATTWFGFGSGNSIGVVGPGATTYFRIYGFLSNNTNPGADFNLDNVVINGCVQPVQPTIGKAFAPNPIAAGTNSILTFTLNNSNAAALNGATFSDTLPAGMTVATAGFVSNSCGFTGTAPGVGDGSLAFSGGTIPASSSCSVSVRVTSSVPGPSTNISGFISTTETGENGGPGGSATATLTVIAPPVIAKNFDPSPILAGGVSTLTFAISNPNLNNAISGVAFTDTFPVAMVVANPTGAGFSGCGAPTYTPAIGAGSISFSGGSILAGTTCTVTVDVTVPANGSYVNTSGNVSHIVNGVPVNGNTASDTLVVNPPNPAIGLLKEVGPTGAGAWAGFLASNLPGSVFYRFTIENLGDVPLSPITLTDPDISLVGCVLPASLPVADANDDDHIFSCVVGGFAAALGTHPNTATAGGSFGATPVSDTDTATYGSTGLTLVKSAAPMTYTAAGEVITYTFTVTNSGAATLSGPISVIDDQTSNETCPALTTVGDFDAFFDPGEVIVCTATYTTTALDVTNTSVTNIAYATNGSTDSPTDTETVTLTVPAPQLTLTKTASASPWTVGVVASYTLQLSNTGTAATTAVSTITDTIPAGLTIGALPAGCSAAGQTVTCTVAAGLAAGGSTSFVIPVTPTIAAIPSVTNTATVSGGGDPTCPGDPRCDDTVITPVGGTPQLTLTKTASASPWTVGVAASYTLQLSNTGSAATTAVSTITDTIPAGLTIGALPAGCSAVAQTVTCTVAAGLAAGGSTSFVIPVTPTIAAIPSVTNTATVNGGGDPTCPADARCTSTVTTPINAPQLTLTKTASASPWTVGVAASYTLQLSNTGTAATTAVSTITDTIPAGLTIGALPAGCSAAGQTVTCTVAAGLAAGGSTSFVIPVTPTLVAVPSVTNTATVNGGGDPTCPADARCTSTVTTPINAPQLTLTKTASASPWTVGVAASYTLQLSNTGTAATTAVSTITDTIPAGLTIGALPAGCSAAGQTVTCTVAAGLAAGGSTSFVIPVTPTLAAAPSATNTATVSGGGDPTCPADARCTSTVTTPINAPQLTLTKTASASPWTVGVAASYTLQLSNTGTAATTAVSTITDTIPAGLTIGALPAGCSAAGQTVTCTVAAGLAAGGSTSFVIPVTPTIAAIPSVTNTATVSGGGDPTCPGDPSCDDTVITPVGGTPQLTLTKTASASPWTVGVPATYTITVQNTGTAATTAVATITDTINAGITIGALPAGCSAVAQTVTCTIPAGLAIGASTSFVIPVTPTISATNGDNTATVSGGGDPTCPANARCDDTVLVPINAPILNVTKTASPNPFVIGQPAAYMITVLNSGAAATTAPFTITDNLPAGITLQSAVGAGWSCVGTTNLSCTYGGVLGAGASTVLTLNVIVSDSATTATNTAVANGGGDPGCPAAPRCDDTVVVPVTRPDLALVKTHSGNFIRGQSGGIYTLTISNVGTAASSGLVTVVDTLPMGLTADSIGGTGWSCGLATLTCTRADALAAGASYPPITIGVTVDAAAPDNLLNTAVVSGGGDTDPSNNNDDDPVTVINGGPATPLVPVPVDSRFALLLLALAMWGMALVARRRVV